LKLILLFRILELPVANAGIVSQLDELNRVNVNNNSISSFTTIIIQLQEQNNVPELLPVRVGAEEHQTILGIILTLIQLTLTPL